MNLILLMSFFSFVSSILSKDLPFEYFRNAGRFDNPKIAPEYDCALRAFTIEMAAYIAPPSSKASWTSLSESAFQMHKCNVTFSSPTKQFESALPTSTDTCQYSVFVDDTNGNDLFNGTID